MDDQSESRQPRLAAPVRKAAAQARDRGEVFLRGVRRSVAELGDRLKSSQASQQVSSAVESWRLIKKAADAQQRGNHAMAYRLLAPKVQESPEDPRLVSALWAAALPCDQTAEVAPYMVATIRRLVRGGDSERAAELWTELRGAVPSARVDPSSLVHIAEVLQQSGAGERLIRALRDAAEFDSRELSPGVAVRIVEMAREHDPRTALLAVRKALEASDLHEARRASLEQLEEELVAAGASSAPSPDAQSDGDPTHAAAGEAIAAVDSIARFHEVKLREAMPTGLGDDAISLKLPGGRGGRIEYEKIHAIAVAKVLGLAPYPVVVIDLLLNWFDDDPSLRVVRLRGDGFDPRMVYEAEGDRDMALRGLLAKLLERSGAVALPSLDVVQSLKPQTFDGIEAYAREVLQVES